ncbi:hypothetical protein SNEBB_009603 [Seison nebaliae]|nr:hypothetical protein SNEBB_009603 [Seison nebaliae]
MFKGILNNSGQKLRDILQAIKDTVTEAPFEFKNNGIRIQAMDTAHVMLVDVDILSDFFDEFKNDQEHVIGLNMQSLWKILSCGNGSTKCELSHKMDDDALHVTFDLPDNRMAEYELKLMDLEPFGYDMKPYTKYCEMELSTLELLQLCRNLSNMNSDNIKVKATKSKGLQFHCKGELSKATLSYNSNIHFEQLNEYHGTFSLKYISATTKSQSISSSVRLCFSEMLCITYRFENGMKGSLKFFIAPKIVDDDDDDDGEK